MQLVGQNNNLEIINSWKYLPNFVIIQGAKHTGKTQFVLYLCNKFKLHYVQCKNNVKNIRELINLMTPNSNTVFHLKNFDEAAIQAKNALLKITEEPVPGNYIVITGGPQLKTLESRARKIIMEPFSFTDVEGYMASKLNKEFDYEKIFKAGINTPAKIHYYKDYEKLNELVDYSFNIFNEITYLSPSTFIPVVNSFKDRYEYNEIDSALLFLTMLINIIEENMKCKKSKFIYSYNKELEALIKAKQAIIKEPTLRRRMVLYNAFYQIYKFEEDYNEATKRS